MKKDLMEMLMLAVEKEKKIVNLTGWLHCSLETEEDPTGSAGCWHGSVKQTEAEIPVMHLKSSTACCLHS